MHASLRLDKTANVLSLISYQIFIGICCFTAVIATQYFVYPYSPLSYFNFTLGVVLAALIYSDLKVIPGIIVGLLLAYHVLNIPTAISILLSTVLILECSAGAIILKRYFNFDSKLETISDVVTLLVVMGLIITLFSAIIESIGLSILLHSEANLFASLFLHTWMGKLIGVLLVSPFLLVWSHPVQLNRTIFETIELLLLFSILLVLCGCIFLGWLAIYTHVYSGLPIAFMFFPIIAWASFRFEQHIATTVCIILAAFSFWALDHNIGPFTYGSVSEAFILTWLCIITSSTLSMLLSADITYCKQIRVKLKKSDERLNLATHGSQDGLWDWSDTNNDYIWWSSRFYQLLGYKEDEIESTHSSLLTLMHPEDKRRHLVMLENHINGNGAYNIDIRLRKKFLGYRWFHAKGKVFKDVKSNAFRMAGSIIDINDRKNAEFEIKRLNSKLEHKVELRTEELLKINNELRNEIQSREEAQAEQENLRDQLLYMSRESAMGELSTSLAHELHQPLMSIVNYSQSCLIDLNDAKLDNEIADNITTISKQALDAGSIIDRIKSYLSKNRGHKKIVYINHVIENLQSLLTLEAKKFNVSLNIIFDKNKSCVKVNELQIQQLINNLFRNGIDAMELNQKQSKRLIIKIDSTGSELIKISVIDNGDDQFIYNEKMLEAFFSTKPEKLGMGLSICTTIVQAHGGKFSLIANQKNGATAMFTLPLISCPNDK